MKLRILIGTIFSTVIFTSFSCQKETEFIGNENKVPVADAGQSKNIVLPQDNVVVTGTGTDSDGQVVAYLWSQVAGPAETVIVNPGAPSTQIKGFRQGEYIFQLMVTDNDGATGVDTMKVIVAAPPASTTATFAPANNPNELQLLNEGGWVRTITGIDLPVMTWTTGGGNFIGREIVKFDMSTIPSAATIVSANLYLYSYPSPTINGNLQDANFGSDNSMLVQQITSNWSASTVTVNNMPSVNTAGQIVVPSTTQPRLDLDLNVKDMVQSMVSGNANYGFLLRMQTEAAYKSRLFVSSYNTTHTTLHPKLVVVYR
ncbi:DNRLRE domain-containing protein [Terrimonas ferruginea]|uniref:DNRLRE domain-containing protein n=1 Tax=Terrimonas ferruginea TaxID=249 RepID=UPI0004908176|nr:DNRLRE domain-containing protein [Terrimonas ferruginea]